MHFLLRARAVAVFPGGFGTFDEFFELLTLIQTGKVRPLPILLFGKEFWTRVIDFQALAEEGVISPARPRPVSLVRRCRRGLGRRPRLLRERLAAAAGARGFVDADEFVRGASTQFPRGSASSGKSAARLKRMQLLPMSSVLPAFAAATRSRSVRSGEA